MDPTTAALAEQAGTIASRFESQSSIDEAKERKDAEWQAAYARLGQAPPKREEEQVQDGRTLFERLQSNKESKKEEWDNKMKLGNQYRGLDSEEMAFLAEKARERAEADRKKEQIENAEIMEYRERLAAKNAALMSVEPPKTGSSSSSTAKKVPAKPVKNVKSLMKGIVVKKKPKPVPGSAKPADGTESATVASMEKGAASSAAPSKRPADDSAPGDETKKQKMTSASPS